MSTPHVLDTVTVADENVALEFDRTDPVHTHRPAFEIPRLPNSVGAASSNAAVSAGQEMAYLAGNSLGLQPKAARTAILEELDRWAQLGLAGQAVGPRAWQTYPDLSLEAAAALVGGRVGEAILMGSLTNNLHLLMASFYRPTPQRYRIMIEDYAFPSDSYAVAGQAQLHGLDPGDAVLRVRPRPGEDTIRTEDVLDLLQREGDSVAVVMLGAVNYLTGEVFDIQQITAAGHRAGAIVGWDLAHAAGNIPLNLHDDNVDFAAWCSYKYLNGGPGATAGLYVRDTRADEFEPVLTGWWGNNAATRFNMDKTFDRAHGAGGWQVSNPAIMSLAPVRVSLEIFRKAGMDRLRARSERLTAYLERLVDELAETREIDIITPRDPARRGAQLSLRVPGRVSELAHQLEARGAFCDWRNPNILRVAPTPLYNTFHDIWLFAQLLAETVPQTR